MKMFLCVSNMEKRKIVNPKEKQNDRHKACTKKVIKAAKGKRL